MKAIIAIVSCHRDLHTHQSVRDTWAAKRQMDYKFFIGRGAPVNDEDVVQLDVDDSYEGLTEKALATFDWIMERGYEHVLHVGRDTYVNVGALTDSRLSTIHYAGNGGVDSSYGFVPLEADTKGRYAYASGGAGSWLSAKAMRTILDSPIRHPADDLMFGWALGEAGITLWHDCRFKKSGGYLSSPGQITVHLSKGPGNYDPAWMYECHRLSKGVL